ncbi:MAG: ribonuclease P protein component [Phycisphaerales bacterium]
MSGASAHPHRFPRSARLGHRREYQAVHAARTRVEAGPLVVHALPNELGQLRLGLSIGRRVGGAVRRNRLKRMLREAFRTARSLMPGAYDVVVSARAHADLGLDEYRSLLLDAVEHLHRTWTKRTTSRGTRRTTEDRTSPTTDAEAKGAPDQRPPC